MPKYLIQGSYTPDGLKGLIKEKAAGRKAAVQAGLKSVKGKLECLYYSLGADDVIAIVELPDTTAAAGLSATIGASGMVNIRTTPLLSVAEMDQGLELSAKYRAPGQQS